MGQLKYLVNMTKIQNGASSWAAVSGNVDIPFTNTSGATKYIISRSSNNASDLKDTIMNFIPFLVITAGTTYTTYGKGYLFVHASSDSDILYSQTSLNNKVGTSSIAYTRNTNGWTANITITGTEDATIRSLLFTKGVAGTWNGSSAYNAEEALIFAYILDAPVELNSENNYTANFTFSVEF